MKRTLLAWLLTPCFALPVYSQTDVQMVGSDSAPDDSFGSAVAIDGATVIVGSYGHDAIAPNAGSAYVFVHDGTNWAQEARLNPLDASGGSKFGNAVALDGSTAVIGQFLDNDNGNHSGAAYVFVREAGGWSQQAKLTGSTLAALDQMGIAVAVSGDTAVVGSFGDDSLGSSAGAAYVFTRSGTAWTEETKLSASDALAGDKFGNAVAVYGDTALVGASFDDGVGANSGSVYVFTRSGTTWMERTKLTASDETAFDQFGTSVALHGDSAIVGAHMNTDNGTDSGSAYVFVGSGSTWTEQAKLLPGDGAAGDEFGLAVDIDGDVALVGAHGDDSVGSNSGSAYVFTRGGTSWSFHSKLEASDAADSDNFGSAVSVSGLTTVMGAELDTTPSGLTGSAYAFGEPTPVVEPFVAYCFCDANSPCGNVDTDAGCANSSGQGAVFTTAGSNSAAANDLILAATGLPALQPGLFFYGTETAQIPFGDGQQCVSTQIFRLGPAVFANMQGIALKLFDNGVPPASSGAGETSAGSTFHFQYWYRDPNGACGAGFNMSNGMSITFAP